MPARWCSLAQVSPQGAAHCYHMQHKLEGMPLVGFYQTGTSAALTSSVTGYWAGSDTALLTRTHRQQYAVSRVVVRNGFLTGVSPAEPPLSNDYAAMWGVDSKGHLQFELSWPWKFQVTSGASYQGPVLLEDVVVYVSCLRLLALLTFTCNAQAFTRVDGGRPYLSVGRRRNGAVLRISDSAPDRGCAPEL